MSAAGMRRPADLQSKMGVSRQTVSKWLNGHVEELTPAMLFKLSDALNVNARWLALGPPTTPIKPMIVDPETAEVLQIRDALESASPDAKDQWLSQGRGLVRVVAPKSPANPFPAKVKR